MKSVLIVTMLIFVAAGCGPTYGGGSSASYANPDRRTTTCVITQRDAQQKLLFVVAWTAERGCGSSSRSPQNLLTSIHGQPVRASTGKKAVYALQPNHTFSEIPLSNADLTTLFNEMQKEGFHTSHSQLWQKQVAPMLSNVEVTGGK